MRGSAIHGHGGRGREKGVRGMGWVGRRWGVGVGRDGVVCVWGGGEEGGGGRRGWGVGWDGVGEEEVVLTAC